MGQRRSKHLGVRPLGYAAGRRDPQALLLQSDQATPQQLSPAAVEQSGQALFRLPETVVAMRRPFRDFVHGRCEAVKS